MVIPITEPVYTARVDVTGGREGQALSDDGMLDVHLDEPIAEGGSGRGTNPEQLFAAGYGACFLSAIAAVARKDQIDTSAATVEAEVTLGRTADRSWSLAVTLRVAVPGVEPATADALISAAHDLCPYSNATRGNIEVTLVRLD